jgi:hypothetical protein
MACDSGCRRHGAMGEQVDAEAGEVWRPFGWRNGVGSTPVGFSTVTGVGRQGTMVRSQRVGC